MRGGQSQGFDFHAYLKNVAKNDKRLKLQNKDKYDPPHSTPSLEKHLKHRLNASPFPYMGQHLHI